MSKDTIIKNPLRKTNSVKYTPYIPQYKKLNVEPEDRSQKTESSGSIPIEEEKNDLLDFTYNNYIDNNDYVSDEVATMMGHKNEIKSDNHLQQNIKNEDNKFILIVKDSPVVSSSSEDIIKENIELLLLGEHKKFLNEKISLEDIFLYKKINISYGVSFKE